MLDEARAIPDGDARLAKYIEIENILGEDSPVIPMFYYKHTRVASERVNNGIYSPNGLFQFDKVWLSE
jgi:peptide/nickel transport system substrate-binding protein/oligopeptide transport system substrate-binding protein